MKTTNVSKNVKEENMVTNHLQENVELAQLIVPLVTKLVMLL